MGGYAWGAGFLRLTSLTLSTVGFYFSDLRILLRTGCASIYDGDKTNGTFHTHLAGVPFLVVLTAALTGIAIENILSLSL